MRMNYSKCRALIFIKVQLLNQKRRLTIYSNTSPLITLFWWQTCCYITSYRSFLFNFVFQKIRTKTLRAAIMSGTSSNWCYLCSCRQSFQETMLEIFTFSKLLRIWFDFCVVGKFFLHWFDERRLGTLFHTGNLWLRKFSGDSWPWIYVINYPGNRYIWMTFH